MNHESPLHITRRTAIINVILFRPYWIGTGRIELQKINVCKQYLGLVLHGAGWWLNIVLIRSSRPISAAAAAATAQEVFARHLASTEALQPPHYSSNHRHSMYIYCITSDPSYIITYSIVPSQAAALNQASYLLFMIYDYYCSRIISAWIQSSLTLIWQLDSWQRQ